MKNKKYWIDYLKLEPHPEGGYYRETYKSTDVIKKEHLPPRYTGDRHASDSIYYLLSENDFSCFHRIQSDELWHFYDGTTVLIHVVDQQGEYSVLRLGKDIEKGEEPRRVVPHGCWFAAELEDKTTFALTGCTVSPGFDFSEFEMAKRDALLKEWPQHEEVIKRLAK